MRILVLGGDGFCGWPSALHLSALGHEVGIVDNLSRRAIDVELGVDSLTPIRPIGQRLATWERISGSYIPFFHLDIAQDYTAFVDVLRTFRPDTIVHFAEQRAAPYSMKGTRQKRYTVDNNVNGTHNVLVALTESGIDAHLVHLGTMGVYGYGGGWPTIPDGYLTVSAPDDEGNPVEREILHPSSPGSVYHMTKVLDQTMFQMYAKIHGTRITDLHQGIVWGTQTAETRRHDDLVNRFDYDGDYGTVLNRFVMQAAVGHPLTVHGTGGQTRAFININDTVQCIRLAVENAPESGERVRIMNQMTECHRVRDLAGIVADLTGAEIAYVDNPRVEADENDLVVSNQAFLDLGMQPTTLRTGLLEDTIEIVRTFGDRHDPAHIPCTSQWLPSSVVDVADDADANADDTEYVA